MSDAVSEHIVVDADPATTRDVIIDVEAYPQWQNETKEVEVLSRDAEGRPERARFRVDAKVFTATYVLRYRYDDDRIAWTLEESDQLRVLDGAYDLTGEGEDRTGVDYTLEVVPSVSMPGMLRRRAAKRIVDSALRGLKQRVESVR